MPVLLDGAQSAVHQAIDVQALDCDFFVFTGHKVYGPTGIGVLYGKKEWLNRLPPYQGGGEMIEIVEEERITYNAPPHRFEAGTPAIIEAVGLGAALALAGRRVLLVDLDPQGNATSGLGVQPPEDAPTMAEVLRREDTLENVVEATAEKNRAASPAGARAMAS